MRIQNVSSSKKNVPKKFKLFWTVQKNRTTYPRNTLSIPSFWTWTPRIRSRLPTTTTSRIRRISSRVAPRLLRFSRVSGGSRVGSRISGLTSSPNWTFFVTSSRIGRISSRVAPRFSRSTRVSSRLSGQSSSNSSTFVTIYTSSSGLGGFGVPAAPDATSGGLVAIITVTIISPQFPSAKGSFRTFRRPTSSSSCQTFFTNWTFTVFCWTWASTAFCWTWTSTAFCWTWTSTAFWTFTTIIVAIIVAKSSSTTFVVIIVIIFAIPIITASGLAKFFLPFFTLFVFGIFFLAEVHTVLRYLKGKEDVLITCSSASRRSGLDLRVFTLQTNRHTWIQGKI